MSTIERLFAEIFDRKNRIERLLHQQLESYGESLALNVIADGGRPPPWLWEMGGGTAFCPDPEGLNKEQLISGICFPVLLVNALANPSVSFTISEMKDGNLCKPMTLFREVSKEASMINKQSHNKAIETKVVECYSELDELNRISNSRSSQRDVESNVSKKVKTTNVQGEDGSSNKRTSRTTRSIATSKKADCERDYFVANACAAFHNGYGGRVTRSKSKLLAKVSSDKLAGDNCYYQVDNIANHPTKCQSISAENSDKLQFLKSSTPSETISLAEHKKVIEVHGFQENENTSIEFSKENQFSSRENAASRLEAMQVEQENSTSRQIMAVHCSPHQHIQEGDMLHDAGDISGMEADRSHGEIEEGKVVEDLECAPHFDSNCMLPGLPLTTPTKSDLLNSFEIILDNQVVNTVITSETLSDNSHSHSREEKLCGQLNNATESDSTLWHDEDNPMLGACRMKSVSGMDVISKCACSHVFSGNVDDFQPLMEGSLCNVHVPLLDIQPLEGDSLAAVASLVGKELGNFPVECQGERREVPEVIDPAYNFGHASNSYKPSNTHVVSFSGLDSESSKHDEDNPMLGGTDLQFHKLKECACRMKSVSGMDVMSKCACSHVFSGNVDDFQSLIEGSSCNVHVPLLDLQPLEGDGLVAVASLIGKEVGSFPVECGERQVSEVTDPAYNSGIASNFCKPSNTHVVLFSGLGFESSKHDSSSQFMDCSVCYCMGSSHNHISMLKISEDSTSKRSLKYQIENHLEGGQEGCGHSVHGYKSCLKASFPVLDRGLQKIQSEIFTTEAVSSCLNFSAKTQETAWANDTSTPNLHSVGTTDDDSMLLKSDKVSLCPDTAKRTITEKAITSADGESYSVPSVSRYCLKSSTAHNKNLNSYSSDRALCVSESKQPEVCDGEHANSWPKRKGMKYKSSNLIGTSRPGARSFLDINQQSECEYKTVTLSNDAVLQSLPKLGKNQILTGVPSVAVQNNELYVLEDGSNSNSNINDLLIAPNGDIQIEALQNFEGILSVSSCHEEVRPTNLTPSEAEIHHTSWSAESLFSDVDAFENNISGSLVHYNEFKEPNDAQRYFYGCDITNLSDNAGVKSNYEETMPVFEGFNIDLPYKLDDNSVCKGDDIPSIAKERAFVIEQLRLTSILPTPKSKPYVLNKINNVSDDFHSSPLGILGNMNLGFSIEHNNPDIKHFSTSTSIKLMDISCNIGSQFDATTLERSYSLPSSSAWFGSEPKNPPLTPPVRKFSHGRLAGKMSSSSMTINSIPELTCFRIDENSTTEENADFVQVEYSNHRTSSRNIVPSNSKSLSDVTELYKNNTGFLSELNKFVVRDSLESINSGAASNLGLEIIGSESMIDNKENPGHTDGIQKPQKAASTKSKNSERSRLSCKSSESNGNYQNIRKLCKPSNILSSTSSFVPLINQKKQGAPSLQGMKDIKVKALETAEAAKRLEDQKKMEREKRKAEAKFVREKIKQENVKQLMLIQKKKEEERRRKEEYVAARKRQREEEERKAKERKRRCVEETRTMQRCVEETRTMQREREVKFYEMDQKDLRQKNEQLKEKQRTCKGQNKLEKGGIYRSRMDVELQHHTILDLEASNEHNSIKGVGCSNGLRETEEETASATQISTDLLSYDMSPYQSSDAEDIEDGWRKKKYIPLWARRESLGEIILSNQHLDPKEIFSRKRSFDISQVLSAQVPLRRQLI